MKQLLMTIVAAVMFSSAAMAQDQEKGKKKEEMAKHRTEKMVKDYDLNESQAAKLLELNTKYADKMRPHRGPHGPHGMKGQRPTPDQYKLYQHDMQKHRKGGPRPGPKPEQ